MEELFTWLNFHFLPQEIEKNSNSWNVQFKEISFVKWFFDFVKKSNKNYNGQIFSTKSQHREKIMVKILSTEMRFSIFIEFSLADER